jgi:uncharacterized protein YjbI with pentapeptide repeats
LTTVWLHGSTHWEYGQLKSRNRPYWYDWIAPVNSLDVHGQGLIDDAKLDDIIVKNEPSADTQRWVASFSVAGRDLTEANFSNTDIRQVDFSSAVLNRALLSSAWAKKARFKDAQLLHTSLDLAQLQDASLDWAHLQGASLNQALLLQGASLKGAHASLAGAFLQGAVLSFAQLEGASLDEAQLQGASLNNAQLQGASLKNAKLQGASLEWAHLQRLSLDHAALQGADLGGAYLQGASLDYAQLQGASLVNVCAWRADARKALWTDTRVVAPKTGATEESADGNHTCDSSDASLDKLKRLIASKVPKSDLRLTTMERIEKRLDPYKALEAEEEIAKVWADRERSSPSPEAYEKSLADQWREVGCSSDGAPHVLQGLVFRLFYSVFIASKHDPLVGPFGKDSPEIAKLAAAFLDTDCAGARRLAGYEITELKSIAAKAPPPPAAKQ